MLNISLIRTDLQIISSGLDLDSVSKFLGKISPLIAEQILRTYSFKGRLMMDGPPHEN